MDTESYSETNLFKSITGYEFEKYILTLLDYEAKKRGKSLIFTGDYFVLGGTLYLDHDMPFDAFAPEGLFGRESTIIEIKFFNNHIKSDIDRTVQQLIEKYTRFISALGDDVHSKLLLITNAPNEYRYIVENDVVELWTVGDVIELSKKYPIEYNALIELALSRSNNKKYDKFSREKSNITIENLDKHNDNLINDLIEAIDRVGISLVLGTGVSFPYNKLSWEVLVDKLYSKVSLTKQFDNPDDAISVLGEDKTTKSQYAKNMLGSSYAATLYRCLYPHKKCFVPGTNSLDECARLIETLRSKQNNLVKKVITYNYDNFLEQALDNKSMKYKVLFSKDDFVDLNLPIYHVHGYMPEAISWKMKDYYSKHIVLTDDDYFACYNNPESWAVYTQLSAFKDDTCLFIGNSISDVNEKRLLSETKQSSKSHYAIIYSRGLSVNDLSRLHAYFYYEMNVRIIWAKTIPDIPLIIHKITDKAK